MPDPTGSPSPAGTTDIQAELAACRAALEALRAENAQLRELLLTPQLIDRGGDESRGEREQADEYR